MRQVRFAFAFFCLLISAAAFAQTQLTATPQTFYQYAAEDTVTFSGSGIAGLDHTVLILQGQPGTFPADVEPLDANTIQISVPPFVTESVGTWTVEIDAYDTPTGSPRVYTTTISVIGIPQTDPPILGLPEIILAEAASPSGANVSYNASAINDDGSPVAVTCDHASGALYPIGTTFVSCSATNGFGTSSGGFYIVVADSVPPVLTVPSDIFATNPVVTWTASATDAIDGSVPVVCSPASGSTFATGTTLVNCSATDAHENTSFASFNVTVGVPPTLTLPADITAEATSAAGAVVTYIATADQNATVVCSPASGSTFALGTTTVNCTATNAGQQSTSGSFHITVVDTTPPSITVPSTITAEATSAAGAAVTYTVSATDLVDGTVGVTCTPASGSTFALGSTTVNCTSTDAHSNTASRSFTINVVDTTPPVITSLTVSPSVLWPPDHKMVPVTVTATATDLVDPSPLVHIISISSSQPVDAVDAGDGVTTPDWVITGPLTADLRAERTSGVDRIYTIVVEAVDASNNSVTGTVQVKVTQQSSSKSHAVH